MIDTDLLTCPPERIGQTKVLDTYLAGKRVFHRDLPTNGTKDTK